MASSNETVGSLVPCTINQGISMLLAASGMSSLSLLFPQSLHVTSSDDEVFEVLVVHRHLLLGPSICNVDYTVVLPFLQEIEVFEHPAN